jgi:type II secretory pathway pseudopilin PulG
MSYDPNEFDTADDAPLPEESNNNRTFLIAVGILGGIILISIACLVGVYLFGSQNQPAQQADEAATQTALANTLFIDQALTATANASILPTATLEPTATSVVSFPTATGTLDPDATAVSALEDPGTPAAATATVGAALTQAAIAQLTIVPTTTALPNTGFIDDYGVPGLVAMSLAFIIVIMLARKLRAVPMR